MKDIFVNSLSEIINSPLVPRSIHGIVTFLLGGNLLAKLPDRHLLRMFLSGARGSFVWFPEVSCLADLRGLCCFFRNVSKGPYLTEVTPHCDIRLLKREPEWSLSCSFISFKQTRCLKTEMGLMKSSAESLSHRHPYLLV